MSRTKFLLAAGLLLGNAAAALAAPMAILTEFQGKVSVTRKGAALPVKAGLPLEAGDRVQVTGGRATVFSLNGPPRVLKGSTSLTLAGGPAASPGAQNMWQGVYDGVKTGFASRGKRVAATVRPGVAEAIFPPASQLLETRPRFLWSVGSLDPTRIRDYEVQVKSATGATVWTRVTPETSLPYPADLPALQGPLVWQVVPRTGSEGKDPVPVSEWASAPVSFGAATATEAQALRTQLKDLAQLLAGSAPELTELAAGALLYQRGYHVEAASRLEPLSTEPALVLLRDVYLQSGQLATLRALDGATAPATSAPQPLDPILEAALVFPKTALPPDGRRRFTAPDGAFTLDVPSRWGVLQTPLPNGGQFYQWTLLNWPRTSLAVVPTVAGEAATPKLFAQVAQTGSPVVAQEAVTVQFQGQPARKTLWSMQDRDKKILGESIEMAVGARTYVFSQAALSRDSTEYLALTNLWSTLKFEAKPAPNTLPATIPPDQLGPIFEAYLKEMKEAVSAIGEVNQANTRKVTAVPTEDATLEARLAQAPANSREKAELAHAAALAAGARIWKATLAGQPQEANTWTERRARYSRESYSSLKGYYEGHMAATDRRLEELSTNIPTVWTANSISILLDMLHDVQAARAGDLMEFARGAGDNATEAAMARKRLVHRRAQLAPSLLVTDARPNRLFLQVLNVVGEMGYVAESSANYDVARSIYRRTAALRQQVDATPSERNVNKPWRDLAALESRAGNIEAAYSAYLLVLTEIDAKKPGRLQEIEAATDPDLKEVLLAELWQSYSVAYNNLAILEQDRGNYQAAEKLYNKALESLNPLPEQGFGGRIKATQRARSLSNLGSLKADSGQTAAARALFLESSQMLRSLGDDGQAAVTLLNMAGLRHYEEDKASVRAEVEIALALFRQTQQVRELLLATGFLAKLDIEEKKPQEAQKRLEEALGIARARGDLDTIASMARLLARARLASLPAARPLTDAQLAPARESLREAEAADAKSGSSTSRINTQNVRSELLESAGDLPGATQALGTAILRLEAVRSTAGSDEAFSEDKGNYAMYARMVRLLLAQNKPEEAFDYLSRARSKKLQDNLRLGSLKSPDPALQRLLDRAAALDTRLRTVRSQLDEEKSRPQTQRDPQRIQTLENVVASTQAEFFTVAAGIKDKFPAFDKVVAVKPRELRKAQRALPEGALLLQYAPLGDALYIFVVTRDDLKIYNPPGKPADLNRLVRQYRKFMDEAQAVVQSGKTLPAPNAALTACSQALYKMLLAPVQAEVDAAQVVAIIPTGELYYLPFHALQRQAVAATAPRYLIQDKAVAYLAAADVLAVVQPRDAADWGTGLLALGDPPGANLPAAAEEVRAIARIYPGSLALTGAQATKAVLFEAGTERRRVLHLAAHGVLDPVRPDRSYIQLAPGTEAGDDGRLRLGEVYGLKLDKIDLVTLSACRTALGEGQPDGSEITSLAESFSSAGTPSVLATLWSVEDQSTRLLMETFYQNLAAGKSKAISLRTAQTKLLENPATAHPFYWAPFELLGDWR